MIMNKLPKLSRRFFAPILALMIFALTFSAPAASWNDAVGMGSSGDQIFSGFGTPLSVVSSVISNSTYYVASAKGDGTPRVTQLLTKNDLTGYNLDFYSGTNVWLCASNQPAGTNIIWLTTTNSMMATNDILVLRTASSDSYQVLVAGGGSTDATGLVYTNSAGYVGIKVWNTPTNTVTAGDQLYKMARLVRFNPLSDHTVTNVVLSPWGNWLNLNNLGADTPLTVSGRAGWPFAVIANYSNAASIYVSGEYYRRPRF